jgi:hypothetical protein
MFLWFPVLDLARAPCRAPLTARKMGSGYENGPVTALYVSPLWLHVSGKRLDLPQVSLEWVLIGYIQFIMRSVLNLKRTQRPSKR